MDPQLKTIFVSEVERQCTFALIACSDLEAAYKRDMDRTWYSVQALLVAVGNISKLLRPASQSEQRGRVLRETLQVKEDSVLAPRTFRNHFEHFDERLERWWTSSQHRNFVDSNVLPPSAVRGIDPGDFLRNFDPESFDVTFRGDKYPLKPIVDAVRDLQAQARRISAR